MDQKGMWPYQEDVKNFTTKLCPPGEFATDFSVVRVRVFNGWVGSPAWIGTINMTCSSGNVLSFDCQPSKPYNSSDVQTSSSPDGYTSVAISSDAAIVNLFSFYSRPGFKAPMDAIYSCPPSQHIAGFSAAAVGYPAGWISDLSFACAPVGPPAAPPFDAPVPPPPPGLQNWVVAVLAVASGLIVVVSLLLLLVCWRRRKVSLQRKASDDLRHKSLTGAVKGPRSFDLELLNQATDAFSASNFLGKGGFGEVFFGQLPETDPFFPGQKIAVKRQNIIKGSTSEDFYQEVEVLSLVRHRNVVQLRGFCETDTQRFLVYEFAENGSLYKLLKAEREKERSSGVAPSSAGPQVLLLEGPQETGGAADLPWERRLELALGAARGLRYLHFELNDAVLHLDIKSENILVDANFNAKVADFGLSKVKQALPLQELQESLAPAAPGQEPIDIEVPATTETLQTAKFQGTPCYIDPSWFQENTLTRKSDVYSFGIVLLELATGHAPQGLVCNGHPVSLPKLVLERVNDAGFGSIAAPSLQRWIDEGLITPKMPAGHEQESAAIDNNNLETNPRLKTFQKFLCLAMWCCLLSREKRPTMRQVYGVLAELQNGRTALGEEACVLSQDGYLQAQLWNTSARVSSGQSAINLPGSLSSASSL